MSEGVVEGHVGGFHESPGLSFQHRVSLTRSLLDELRSSAELFDELPAHTGKLKMVLGSPYSVTGAFKLRCQQMVEVGLVESAITYRVSDFQGFPFFDRIEGRTSLRRRECGNGGRDPIDGSSLAVDKLCIDHVRAKAIGVLIPLSNLGFHSGLDCRHGFVDRFSDHLLDNLVIIDGQI